MEQPNRRPKAIVKKFASLKERNMLNDKTLKSNITDIYSFCEKSGITIPLLLEITQLVKDSQDKGFVKSQIISFSDSKPKKEGPVNRGKRWTRSDVDRMIKRLMETGGDISVVAKELGRTNSGVLSRLALYLGSNFEGREIETLKSWGVNLNPSLIQTLDFNLKRNEVTSELLKKYKGKGKEILNINEEELPKSESESDEEDKSIPSNSE